MTFKDYLKYFDHTCINLEIPKDYVQQSLMCYGVTGEDTEQACFYLTLDEDIDCKEAPMSAEVIQQGEKLSLYRKEPSTF